VVVTLPFKSEAVDITIKLKNQRMFFLAGSQEKYGRQLLEDSIWVLLLARF